MTRGAELCLGLMPPLTGVVSMYGQELCRSAALACEQINATGGVLGRALRLHVEDDGSLPHSAVSAARRLVEERGCRALIGNLLSAPRAAVNDVVESRLRVPLLNFAFADDAQPSHFLFHFAANVQQHIVPLIEQALAEAGPRVFLIGNRCEWSRASLRAARACLRHHDADLVGEQYFDYGIGRDSMDALLERIEHSRAQWLLPCLIGRDQLALLTRLARQPGNGRRRVASPHLDETLLAALSDEARVGLLTSGSYFRSIDSASNRDYLAALRERQPAVGSAALSLGSQFGEAAWLCVHAFAQAANAAGSCEPEALSRALHAVRVQAPQGEVRMQGEGGRAAVQGYLARSEADGEFRILRRFEPPRSAVQSLMSGHAAGRAQLRELVGELELATAGLAAVEAAVLACDALGTVRLVNRQAALLFACPAEQLLGRSLHELIRPGAGQQDGDLLQYIGNECGGHWHGELQALRADSDAVPLSAALTCLDDGPAPRWLFTLRDVSERKRADVELVWRASHDALTGLPNRMLIRERVLTALRRSQTQGRALAVLFVDLDGFKQVNDAHGHERGDLLLKDVAQRLLEQVRPGDHVGRVSGDEFIILCEQLDHPTSASALAERLNNALRRPFRFNEFALYLSASIGIAFGEAGTHTADDLLRAAEAAMYEAKAKGCDGWQFFSQALYDKARQRMAISQGLRWAIERDEFSTRLQPIVDAECGRILAAELLLRWRPPQGEVGPDQFIPVAELTGAILPIGAWVFQAACEIEVDWRRRWGGAAPRYLAVNLSARQLAKDDLNQDFARILERSGADPGRILLEVTESSLMADVDSHCRVLRRLVDLGLQVAVDDFGTGYSSLAQLNRLPVSVLKIDRAFVDGVETQTRTVFRAIVGLGRALGLNLVAEGVETERQRAEVVREGCPLAQGYLFYRPMPAEDFVTAYQAQLAAD